MLDSTRVIPVRLRRFRVASPSPLRVTVFLEIFIKTVSVNSCLSF